jgi:hypothetical protein
MGRTGETMPSPSASPYLTTLIFLIKNVKGYIPYIECEVVLLAIACGTSEADRSIHFVETFRRNVSLAGG